MLLDWSHRYTNHSVVITIYIWMTVAKYPYLNWQWIFSFLRRLFFFLLSQTSLSSNLTIDLYIWVTWRVSYKKQELFILGRHLGSPSVFGGIRVVHLFSFLCCIFFVLVLFCVLIVPVALPRLFIHDCPFGFSLTF